MEVVLGSDPKRERREEWKVTLYVEGKKYNVYEESGLLIIRGEDKIVIVPSAANRIMVKILGEI